MKPLPLSFRRTGILTTQVKRTERFAIYELTMPHWKSPKYEVIRIRRRGDRMIGATKIEAAEQYPASESWGNNGWSFSDRESAEAKYRELNATPAKTPAKQTALSQPSGAGGLTLQS